MSSEKYEPLTIETLADRLGSVDAICKIVGDDTSKWNIDEVGDGNLNLVYTVSSDSGNIIIKQALPYVRLVGDSWPLPLSRSFYEHEVLVRQAKRDPGSVPVIYYFDKEQAIIAMEMLLPHIILRKKLIAGEYINGLAQRLGEFCARNAFSGSDLSLHPADKKSATAIKLF